MRIGMIGLGRMGSNMARRLTRGGHEIVAYDHDPKAVAEVVGDGAIGAASLEELDAQLASPAIVWVM